MLSCMRLSSRKQTSQKTRRTELFSQAQEPFDFKEVCKTWRSSNRRPWHGLFGLPIWMDLQSSYLWICICAQPPCGVCMKSLFGGELSIHAAGGLGHVKMVWREWRWTQTAALNVSLLGLSGEFSGAYQPSALQRRDTVAESGPWIQLPWFTYASLVMGSR